MNTRRSTRNYLIEGPTNLTRKSIFRNAYILARRNHTVLFISQKQLDELPLDDEIALPSRNILKNILFRYAKSIEELRQVVLKLHTFEIAPRLLIIDSMQEFFNDAVPDDLQNDVNVGASTPADYIDFCNTQCMLTAAVQNAVDSMSQRVGGNCASIISFDSSGMAKYQQYYERFRSKFIQFFFFDAENVLYGCDDDDLEKLKQKLMETLIAS